MNAPLVLNDLFAEFSVEYRKTTHSIELTEWLLAHKVDHLRELLDYVSELVQPTKPNELSKLLSFLRSCKNEDEVYLDLLRTQELE